MRSSPSSSCRVGDFYLAGAVDLLSRTAPAPATPAARARKKVTYRDLDVRSLGEIYEGLKESQAHIAPEEQVIFERTQGGSNYEEYVAASDLNAGERRAGVEQYRQAHAEDPDLPRVPAGCKVTGIKEKGQYYLVPARQGIQAPLDRLLRAPDCARPVHRREHPGAVGAGRKPGKAT